MPIADCQLPACKVVTLSVTGSNPVGVTSKTAHFYQCNVINGC